MDKRADRKSHKISGAKQDRIGTPLGIHDMEGTELCSGDEVFFYAKKCIILWNRDSFQYEAMLSDTCWYGNKDKYDAESYGKSLRLPMDDGARMEIKRIA